MSSPTMALYARHFVTAIAMRSMTMLRMTFVTALLIWLPVIKRPYLKIGTGILLVFVWIAISACGRLVVRFGSLAGLVLTDIRPMRSAADPV